MENISRILIFADLELPRNFAKIRRRENFPFYGIVLDQPIPDIPVFKVKREDGHGRLQTLHRNQLLPFTGLPAPIIDEESDDVREEEAEEAPDSDSHLFQYHDTSSEADEEPEDTSSQVNQRQRQRRSGESSQLPPRRRPVRQHKPPKWMATGDWVL